MLLALVALAALQQATPGTGPAPYWQQRADYVIGASLDEPKGVLSGHQQVRYRNNSPDTLRQLSFHLYLNAFRPGSRWADADSVEHNRRFNDLKDPDFGFNHVTQRPDHGPGGRGRSIRSRPTARSCGSCSPIRWRPATRSSRR